MTAIRIPGLIDLRTIEDPEAIRDLADSPDLDRRDGGGPLVVRLVRRSLGGTLRAPEGPLPSALPRDSEDRLALRVRLDEQLADPGLMGRLAPAIEAAAFYVTGGEGTPGPLAQTLFGRIFVADFEATDETWSAAETIDRALGGVSLQRVKDALTGKVPEAQATLSRAMAGDRNGVHAIGVAVHNFAETLATLSELDGMTSADAAIAKSLVAPPRVARSGTSVAETPSGSITPGTLVLFQTGRAATRTLDPRVTFLRDAWSGCPAHALVPDLVRRIWLAAGGAP